MKVIPPELCARCKGYKRLCGLPSCPILERFHGQVSSSLRVRGLEVQGSTPPSVLVGEWGYPRVGVYLMIPPGLHGEEAGYMDAPARWRASGESLQGIIRLRSGLISARLGADARDPFTLYEREIALASISSRPTDAEALLSRPPLPRLRFDGVTKPLGPAAPARRVRVTGSPRVPARAERALWDDSPAGEAVWELYRWGVDPYTIQRMLSLGLLGRLRRRRLVPTRWAITAVDDQLSMGLRARLRGRGEVGEALVFHDEYLGNRFTIVVLPGPGSFEWVEAWHPMAFWTRGARSPIVFRLEEDPLGRASSRDGGFSAARLAVLEELERLGARGDVVIFREITPAYYAPVGNWHIRETVRTAMRKGPVMRAPTRGELEGFIEERHSVSPRLLYSASRRLRGRRTLEDYASGQ